jgi:hypothetical protein
VPAAASKNAPLGISSARVPSPKGVAQVRLLTSRRADAIVEAGVGAACHPLERSLVRLGVAGALLAFVVLAGLRAWTTPLFSPPDEASHYGYAVVLSSGGLPTVTTPIPTDGVPRLRAVLARRDEAHRTVWTANHPPLFYALMAAPVRVGVLIGHPLGGLRAARLLSVAIAAVGIILLALLVGELVPGRPELVVAAAGVTAIVPSFVAVSGLLYNDSLAFATSTAALLAAVRFLVRGPSRARLALVAVSASLAALTRASGLVVAAIVVVAVLVGVWRDVRLGGRRPVLAAVWQAGLVGMAVAVTAGWFYLRNYRLYGDFTGASALFQQFRRASPGSVLDVVRVRGYWISQAKRFWDSTYDQTVTSGSAVHRVWWVGTLPTLGLAILAARRLGRIASRPGGIGGVPRAARHALRHALCHGDPRRVALAVLVGLLVLLEVLLAQFTSGGGGSHIRYLFPDIVILALGAALGLAALPGGRRGLPTVALLGAAIPINLWLLDVSLWAMVRPPGGHGAFRLALAAAGLPPEPLLVLVPCAVLLAAAVALQALALWALGRRDLAARPAPPAALGFDGSPPLVFEPSG